MYTYKPIRILFIYPRMYIQQTVHATCCVLFTAKAVREGEFFSAYTNNGKRVRADFG